MSFVQIALIVSGHLGVNMVGRGRVAQGPLYKSQIDTSVKSQGCHRQTTVKAGDRLAEVTVQAVSTVRLLAASALSSDKGQLKLHNFIFNCLNNKWEESHPEYNKQDGVHCLNRRGQTTIFRPRTGHNRLKYHSHKIFKVGETDLCSCGQGAETAQNVPQDCRLYNNVRQSIWRERVDMHTKL